MLVITRGYIWGFRDFPKILMAGGHVSEPGQGKVIALDEMGP